LSEHHPLVPALLASYKEDPRTVHAEKMPLPSREAVASIVEDMLDLLFPGYFRLQEIDEATWLTSVSDILVRVTESLGLQILRAFRHEHTCFEGKKMAGEDQARAITGNLLAGIPQLRLVLGQDVQAAFEGDPAARNCQEVIFCYPGLEAVAIFRVAHELHKVGVPFLPRMMTELAHQKTGIDIHPGARIGPGFFIDHGTGVVIGETCDIGRNVKLYQGVTLGALSFPRDATGNIIRGQKRHPTLEDEVVVYANATILGGETVVGHHAVIGSNVWLTESVNPHTTVLMEKPSLRIRQPGTSSRES
jgi:serine O-acetyltransferase